MRTHYDRRAVQGLWAFRKVQMRDALGEPADIVDQLVFRLKRAGEAKRKGKVNDGRVR